MSATSRSKQWSTRRLICSGSAPADIAVKPTRSAISTVASRRSSSEAPRRWPHSWQNRAPAAVVAPQAGQVIRATLPGRSTLAHSGRLQACRHNRRGSFRGRHPYGAHAGEGSEERDAVALAAPRSGAWRFRTGERSAGAGRQRQPRARRAAAAGLRGRDRRRRGVPVRARERPLPRRSSISIPKAISAATCAGCSPPTCWFRTSPRSPARAAKVNRCRSTCRSKAAGGRSPSRSCRCRRNGATTVACSVSCTTSPSTSASRRCSRTGFAMTRSPSCRTGSCCSSRSATRWLTAADARRTAGSGWSSSTSITSRSSTTASGSRPATSCSPIVAQRVERILRAGDTVARLGGDELAVVCNDAQDERAVIAVAERVRTVLAEPFVLATGEVFLTASIGVALSTGTDDSPERHAPRRERRHVRGEAAWVAAASRSSPRPMREHSVARLEMESALRRALVHEEFRVHYQPLVRFESSEVIGLEALLRWQHPERGSGRGRGVPRGGRGHRADRPDRGVGVARGVRAGRVAGSPSRPTTRRSRCR